MRADQPGNPAIILFSSPGITPTPIHRYSPLRTAPAELLSLAEIRSRRADLTVRARESAQVKTHRFPLTIRPLVVRGFQDRRETSDRRSRQSQRDALPLAPVPVNVFMQSRECALNTHLTTSTSFLVVQLTPGRAAAPNAGAA